MKYSIIGLYILLIGLITQNIILEKKIDSIEYDIEVDIMPNQDTTLFSLPFNRENFEYACMYYELEHPEIIYAQGRLESANFTSDAFINKNNFLGLYNSKCKALYSYDHWTECLRAYKKHIQRKWNKEEDYYYFLARLPYAEDPKYIPKIKVLVNDTVY